MTPCVVIVVQKVGVPTMPARWRHAMNFLDGHLFPENQQPLIITAAPYAPSWLPSDFPGEIAVTMDEQIQKWLGG